jgi:hypothetical protein
MFGWKNSLSQVTPFRVAQAIFRVRSPPFRVAQTIFRARSPFFRVAQAIFRARSPSFRVAQAIFRARSPSFRVAQAIFRAKHFPYKYPIFSITVTLHTYSPMKMEHTQCSETLAFKLQTPVNHPVEAYNFQSKAKVSDQEFLESVFAFIY